MNAFGAPRFFRCLVIVLALLRPAITWAVVVATVRGIVHDPDHRPIPGAQAVVKAANSDYSQKLASDAEGRFATLAIPVGSYIVTVTKDGFAASVQAIVVASGSSPVLHFQLAVAARREEVSVPEGAMAVNPEQMTPTTIVSRSEIAMTPGADLSKDRKSTRLNSSHRCISSA